MPDEPIEHELLRNAVAAEVTVTSSEVSPTSTGDRYVRIEGRLGDDENSHVEWAAVGFIYALGVLSFAAARPRGVSGMDFEEKDQCAYTGPTQALKRSAFRCRSAASRDASASSSHLAWPMRSAAPSSLSATTSTSSGWRSSLLREHEPDSVPVQKMAASRSNIQRTANEPMAYAGTRSAVFGQGNGNPRSPALTSRVTATKRSWPSSMPTLNEPRAKGISPAGRPTCVNAPANPRPWSKPKVKDIAHGKRCLRLGRTRPTRVSSTATAKMVNAISASTGFGGMLTNPSTARESVTLCPAVNAVIVHSNRRRPRTSSTSPSTKSR